LIAAMIVVVVTAVSSCGLIGVAPPDPTLVNNPGVAATGPSVVKIRSEAPACGKFLEGSGFVIAPARVMTNAHVVAGSNNVQVNASGNPFDAVVVGYDPQVDIAILAVPNLPPPPLSFAKAEAQPGASAVVLVIRAAVTSRPPRPGFVRPSNSADPTSTATRSR